MDWHSLQVFQAVASERSFSRAAEKLFRTQPAVSLSVQRLEAELGERLIDRGGKDLLLTDAGRLVLDYARRFENLRAEMENALAELRDNSAGRLTIGANESTTLYLLPHIDGVPAAVSAGARAGAAQPVEQDAVADRRGGPRARRRQLRPAGPARRVHGDLHRPPGVRRLTPPPVRVARKAVSIRDLGMETFIAHNVVSPYRNLVLRAFETYRVPLQMGVEMPTIESIRKLVQANEGVAFLPRMCVEQEIGLKTLREVTVKELRLARQIRLVHPARRALSHAATAFLDLVKRG